MALRPRARHQIVAYRLGAALALLDERGLGKIVPDADLIVDDKKTCISPDVMVFLGERLDDVNVSEMISAVPDLAIDVLSPSNDQYDLGTKRDLYARLGVKHY